MKYMIPNDEKKHFCVVNSFIEIKVKKQKTESFCHILISLEKVALLLLIYIKALKPQALVIWTA